MLTGNGQITKELIRIGSVKDLDQVNVIIHSAENSSEVLIVPLVNGISQLKGSRERGDKVFDRHFGIGSIIEHYRFNSKMVCRREEKIYNEMN